MSQPSLPEQLPAHRIRKLWGFRAGTVAIGLSVLLVIEVTCRLVGWGRPEEFDDPFVGFDALQPLFVRDSSKTRYEIAPARQRFFRPDSFPVMKDVNEFRIFVLGGSTVAGEPYSSETSFTTWLELALQTADPTRVWNVVNCGGISYASYRLTPILKECLQYQPDLFILSTGHNEFLEDRTYGRWRNSPEQWGGLFRTLAHARVVTLARAGIVRLQGMDAAERDSDKPVLPTEVDALLDHEGGLEVYQRDEARAAATRRHFGHNLRAMVSAAQTAAVPLILIHETSNLADCPPFKSEHREGLSISKTEEWKEQVRAARSLPADQVSAMIDQLRGALAIDDQFALTWYELGKCFESRRDFVEARKAFVMARDLDICPLRITTPLEETLFEVAGTAGVPLIDAHQLLERQTATGILGDFWLVDHVHPSFAGHQAIAVALYEEMARAGFVKPEDDSESRFKAAFEQHLVALPPIYFERGRRTLELLRGWTQGRAERIPLQDP